MHTHTHTRRMFAFESASFGRGECGHGLAVVHVFAIVALQHLRTWCGNVCCLYTPAEVSKTTKTGLRKRVFRGEDVYAISRSLPFWPMCTTARLVASFQQRWDTLIDWMIISVGNVLISWCCCALVVLMMIAVCLAPSVLLLVWLFTVWALFILFIYVILSKTAFYLPYCYILSFI